MKAFIYVLGLIICLPAFSYEIVYVQSATAKIKSEPKLGGADVVAVNRGDELKVFKTEGAWMEVQYNEHKGWISKLFVNKTKPVGQADLANVQVNSEAKTSRKRSGNYAVSAATRGLTANERVRDGHEMYRSDKTSVDELDRFDVDESKLDTFQKEGKLLGK